MLVVSVPLGTCSLWFCQAKTQESSALQCQPLLNHPRTPCSAFGFVNRSFKKNKEGWWRSQEALTGLQLSLRWPTSPWQLLEKGKLGD